MDDLRNKHITIAGLGRFGGGITVAKWLCRQGAKVLVTDKDPAEKLADSVSQLDGLDIQFVLGEHRIADFTSCDLVVISPAIPPTSDYIQAARSAGVPVTTEIRLFIERCPAKIIGVTATKGKSTTTALLGMMLKTKHKIWVGGNIGGSLLFDLPDIQSSDLVVLELSSYMLEYLGEMKWSPHVAVVGMLSQDHLAWHGSVENYIDAKRNLVRFLTADDFAILNGENESSLSFGHHTQAQIKTYTRHSTTPFQMRLSGNHNQLNAQGAFAAASVFGVTHAQAQDAIRDFGGLPHRLEMVHELNGVKYINDSIATIPEAAIAALGSFPEGRVIQIVGGDDKGLDMTSMCDALAKHAKAVLCVGRLGQSLSEMISQFQHRQAKVELCETLPRAVESAKRMASPGDVVLLSTGCASYDQFANFEKRGEAFIKLVRDTGN